MKLLAAFAVIAIGFAIAWHFTSGRPTVIEPPATLEHDKRLDTYDWVDREHGIIRIPIERAMERVVDGKR